MKPDYMQCSMRLYFTDTTFHLPVGCEASHHASNTHNVEFDFDVASDEYYAMLASARKMIANKIPFSFHTDVSLQDALGNTEMVSSTCMRFLSYESNQVTLDFWRKDQAPVLIERPATQATAEKALAFCYGHMLAQHQAYKADLDLSDPEIAASYDMFLRAPNPAQMENALFPAEPAPQYVSSIEIPYDEVAQYNAMLQMTGAEIYQKYGLKRDEAFNYTVKFGDGCTMDVRLVVGEWNERPDMFFELYDAKGRAIAQESSVPSFAGEYTLDTTQGSYTTNVKSGPVPSLADRIRAANQKRDEQVQKQNAQTRDRKEWDR